MWKGNCILDTFYSTENPTLLGATQQLNLPVILLLVHRLLQQCISFSRKKKKKDLNTIFLPTDTPWTDTMCFCNAQCNTLPGEWGKLCSVHGLRCRPHCKCLWRSVEKHSHLNHFFKPLYGHYFCLKGCAGTTAEVTFPYLGFSIYSIYIQF